MKANILRSLTCGFFMLSTAAGSAAASGANPSLQLPSQASILATISQVNDYWIQNHSAGSNNNYWDGSVYVIGDMAAYDATGNSNYLNYGQAWASSHRYSLLGGDSTHNANNQAAGEVYVRLYQILGTSSDLTHITADVKGMVNGSGSGDWSFVDTLNMAMPVFAELGQINADPAYSAKMYSEFSHTKSTLYDQSQNLWWRDSSYVGTSFWSRGNAWAFVALAKVLETLPTTDPNYAEYLDTFRAMAAKLITLQQSDGFWRSNLLNPSEFPNPETSGTAGFTFGLAWGINSGALDSATYLPAVTKAWNGMVATAVHSNGFLGYVQGVGTSPGSSSSSSTTNFGVGLFLQAGKEMAKLATAGVAPPAFSSPSGTYTSSLAVTITSATSGASIAYTTDGTTPTESGGTVTHGSALPNGGSVLINATTTLTALAYKIGMTDSTVFFATYTINALTPPPMISSPGTASGTVGSAFSYQITASNSPTSYGAIGLPAGLSVDAPTGLIGGTPTAAGTSSVTISATNANGTGTQTLTLTVTPQASNSWDLVGAADFLNNGNSDLILQNTVTGERTIWLMNGTTHVSTVSIATIPTEWDLVGAADFKGDGNSDLIWQDKVTGERAFWLMNGTTPVSSLRIATIPTNWDLVGAADFSGTGQPDLIWQDTTTGQRALWLMNGTTYASSVSLGMVPTDWNLVGAADFLQNGNSDLIWQDTTTGQCALWLMNGTTYASSSSLGMVSTNWKLVGTGAFSGTGNHQPDLIWQDTTSNQYALWLMNGTTYVSGVSFTLGP